MSARLHRRLVAIQPLNLGAAVAACLAALSVALTASAATGPLGALPVGEHVGRVVLVERHGVRSPLATQAPAREVLDLDWPQWGVAPGALTPRGAAGMTRMGHDERARLAAWGLLVGTGCPENGEIRIAANSTERTIASAAALAEGLAPGCGLTSSHKPEGVADALFEPAHATPERFDMRAILPRMEHEVGPVSGALDGAEAALATLRRIAACPGAGALCALDPRASRFDVSDGGHGLRLEGTLDVVSGMAELLMLEYLDGHPAAAVGWGRASVADLAAISELHGRMLEAVARAPALGAPASAPLRRAIATDLEAARAPALSVYVGHDSTIEQLLGLLGAEPHAPGYALQEVPIGSALGFARIDDAQGHAVSVQMFYLSQTPQALRILSGTAAELTPLRSGACQGHASCSLRDFCSFVGGMR